MHWTYPAPGATIFLMVSTPVRRGPVSVRLTVVMAVGGLVLFGCLVPRVLGNLT